jgi:hypothetical protein
MDPMESAFDFLSTLIINIRYSRKCSGQFRIAESELNHQSKKSDAHGGKEHGRKVSMRRSRGSHAETVDEEVISPASYVTIIFVYTILNDHR